MMPTIASVFCGESYRTPPLSENALREDFQVAHKTLTNWLTVLERLYAIYRLAPLGSPRIRDVKKAQKHYQFD